MMIIVMSPLGTERSFLNLVCAKGGLREMDGWMDGWIDREGEGMERPVEREADRWREEEDTLSHPF